MFNSYDENGNRIQKTNGWGSIDYTYNAENRMLSAGKKSYSYDANGNMIQQTLGSVSTVYEYNAENRVVDINTQEKGLIGRWQYGAGRELKSGVRYDYDAFGRRVTRAEYSTVSYGLVWKRQWDKENVSEYLYDGKGMNVLAEYNDSDYNPSYSSPWLPWCMSGMRPFWGGMYGWRTGRSLWSVDTRSNYELKSEYVYGNGIVSRNDWTSGYRYSYKTGVEYYHTDMLGSVMMTSNAAGLMTNRYHYDVFGNNYTGSLAGSNALGYGGKRYDPATSFYDYGFRDYDSRTGRFTTADPIRDGVNWYVYCNNDPVNFFDLWGLKPAQDKNQKNDEKYQWPLEKNVVTSEFGHRTDAVPNQHDGLDLRAEKGTTVYAMADGKVSLADLEYSGSASKSSYLIIDGTDGYQQRYLHMDTFAVKEGDSVNKGQILGTTGDKKDMPEHLHIEIRKGSEKIDPRKVLPEL